MSCSTSSRCGNSERSMGMLASRFRTISLRFTFSGCWFRFRVSGSLPLVSQSRVSGFGSQFQVAKNVDFAMKHCYLAKISDSDSVTTAHHKRMEYQHPSSYPLLHILFHILRIPFISPSYPLTSLPPFPIP